jgi:hypothetical protein
MLLVIQINLMSRLYLGSVLWPTACEAIAVQVQEMALVGGREHRPDNRSRRQWRVWIFDQPPCERRVRCNLALLGYPILQQYLSAPCRHNGNFGAIPAIDDD